MEHQQELPSHECEIRRKTSCFSSSLSEAGCSIQREAKAVVLDRSAGHTSAASAALLACTSVAHHTSHASSPTPFVVDTERWRLILYLLTMNADDATAKSEHEMQRRRRRQHQPSSSTTKSSSSFGSRSATTDMHRGFAHALNAKHHVRQGLPLHMREMRCRRPRNLQRPEQSSTRTPIRRRHVLPAQRDERRVAQCRCPTSLPQPLWRPSMMASFGPNVFRVQSPSS